jgi:hypothetical protein
MANYIIKSAPVPLNSSRRNYVETTELNNWLELDGKKVKFCEKAHRNYGLWGHIVIEVYELTDDTKIVHYSYYAGHLSELLKTLQPELKVVFA